VYSDIAEELKYQYWLAYTPKALTGGFKSVSVRMPTNPTFRARTRSGYYATPPAREPTASRNPQ
jgi:hypothetical protein